ncbi:MAG: aspartate aminotransferase family protein [Acidobacteria bacterium]|nr:aspartate aminotransferase family protein [Acidobacteriota bacterium]
MDIKEFRKHAHDFADWMADFLENIESYRVMPETKPGDIKEKLPKSAPEKAEDMKNIFSDFENIVLPGMTHWQHPSFFAYFPANSSPPSVLAEMLTATMAAQCMSWITSPAATEMEEVVMEWLRQMTGLPEGFTGVIQDSASSSTLGALICAREKVTGFAINEKGFTCGGIPRMAIYTSRESHSSIEKGAKIAGYGREMIRKIGVDEKYAMIPALLEEAIRKDIEDGIKPASVVAACGTTSSLAVDPLPEIGEICKKYDVWLHVDGAMAGSAAILPEKRYLLSGIEYADSFVFNPHKWLFTNFDCSAYYCKDPKHLIHTFSIDPEYLKTDVDMKVKNFRDWGIPLGRRFRALKLWMVIRSYGIEGLQKKLQEHIRLAGWFAEQVEAEDDIDLLAPVDLDLVCFRYNKKSRGLNESELEKLNKKLMDALNSSGEMFISHTKLGEIFTLRMSIGGTYTEERHVRAAWNRIKDTMKSLE